MQTLKGIRIHSRYPCAVYRDEGVSGAKSQLDLTGWTFHITRGKGHKFSTKKDIFRFSYFPYCISCEAFFQTTFLLLEGLHWSHQKSRLAIGRLNRKRPARNGSKCLAMRQSTRYVEAAGLLPFLSPVEVALGATVRGF